MHSIVYYSIQQGLWSNSENSVQLYGRVYNSVAPYIKDNVPKEVTSEVNFITDTDDQISNAYHIQYF